MSNKIKKLICSLLATAMFVSSVGVVAFADDENDAAPDTTVTTQADGSAADEAEGTDAAEPAEAPTEAPTEAPAEAPAEVTPAPVVATGTNYDNDAYYQKALALCQSLGIISGYEDGSVKPDSKVTRAEMSSIVLRMLATNSFSKYKNIFKDVADSHWAADQIQSAYEGSIISGMGDGTFAPDSQVTYAQVIVMLVNACGYHEDAEYYGGWQQGYIKAAGSTELDLLVNAQGNADEAADRGLVIKMVYNALLGDYKEIRSYEGGQPKYSSDRTLAEAKFDVIEAKGLLIGTSKTTIGTTDIQEGQIEIKKDKEDNSEVYNTTLTDLDDCIGRKVTYYYKENSGKSPEVLAVTYDSTKSDTYVIDSDKIDSISIDGGVISVKEIKTSKAKVTEADPKVIYNGKLVDSADVDDDLFNMEKGTITLVKSDKNDVKDYDVVFVDSYTTMVITSASDKKLIGKIQDPDGSVGDTKGVTIDLDNEKTDRSIKVTKAGEEIRVRNLKKNDVATVRASLPLTDPEVLDIVVTGESIIGSVASMSVAMNDTYASINGTQYSVANVAVADLKTGAQGTFYTDKFGRIGYIDSSISGRLESGEKYGWVLSQYKGEGSNDKILKIMTQDGVVEAGYATNVDYWAPATLAGEQYAGVSVPKATIENFVEEIFEKDSFAHMWNDARQTTGTATHFDRPHIVTPGSSIRLVKYRINGNGKITRLYFAVNAVNLNQWLYKENYDSSYNDILDEKYITEPYLSSEQIAALKSSNALIFDQTNKAGSTITGGLLGGYNLTDDAIEFTVPTDESRYSNATSYTVANVNSAKYNVRENGVGDKYIFGDFTGTTPAVLIKFAADPESPVEPGDLDTYSNNASIVVDKIGKAVDADGETVYVIKGYSAGTETSVTTKVTSALGDMTGYNSSSRKYTVDKLWDGKNGGEKGKDLANYLQRGDIIVTDGSAIVRFYSAEQAYEEIKEGKIPSKTITTSETRNNFYFGTIVDADVDDVSWLSINGSMFSMDASAIMDVVEIDMSTGIITISDEYATVSDVMPYSTSADEYDIAMARTANKGSLQEVVIYRILNAQ